MITLFGKKSETTDGRNESGVAKPVAALAALATAAAVATGVAMSKANSAPGEHDNGPVHTPATAPVTPGPTEAPGEHPTPPEHSIDDGGMSPTGTSTIPVDGDNFPTQSPTSKQ